MTAVVNSSEDNNYSNHLTGIVILAGGASKRMGTPKAELILPTGERLLDYHVRQALKLRAALNHEKNIPIMVADNERGFTINKDLDLNRSQSSIHHITDYLPANDSDNDSDSLDENKIKTGGSLVAIESALQSILSINNSMKDVSYHRSWLMVISCDSLLSATDLWQKIAPSTMPTVDRSIICLTDDCHLYPLLGIYRLDIEADLKRYLDNGNRQVMKFIQPMVKSVALPNHWKHLTNFNTPKEFELACTALNSL